MTVDPKYLIYHDLIGFPALARKKSKSNSDKFSDIGLVIDETRNMLITDKNNHTKKYVKKEYLFRFKIENKMDTDKDIIVEVDGDKIIGVPENRLRSLRKKRRFKK